MEEAEASLPSAFRSRAVEGPPPGRWRRLWRSPPVILQGSAYECGAASLAMIVGYWGRPAEPRDCAECYDAGRDGVSAAAIARDARRLGLTVKSYGLELRQLRHLPLPAIAYWDFRHFLVIERVSAKAVQVIDPAVGRRRLTWEEVDRSFTGVALTFSPGPNFERKVLRTSPRRLRPLLAGLRTIALPLMGQLLLLSILLQLTGLAFPLFTKILVDHLVPSGALDATSLLLAGLGTVVTARLGMSILRARLSLVLRNRIDWILMRRVVDHLLHLPLRFFQRRPASDVLNRLAGAATIRELISTRSLHVVLDGAFAIGYLACLLSIAPSFALVAVLGGLLEAVFVILTSRQVQYFIQETVQAQTECNTVISESVQGIETLKIAGAERAAASRWSDLFSSLLALNVRRANVGTIMDASLGVVQSVAPLLIVWLGARQVQAGTMTVGTMLALNVLVAGVLGPLGSLAGAARSLQVAGVHLRRLWSILDEPREDENPRRQPAPNLSGAIELRDVSFRYSDNAPFVLQRVSVSIAPGQKVALVGASGSGKSTLAALLLGLHPPSEGQILFDGASLSDLDGGSLRRQLGVVPQEPFLFTGSIRENIALGDGEVPLEAVRRAARQACVEDDIRRMAMGYHTVLAGGGRSLSGGQKQRLALARALLRPPAVLLLDEATSHLDAATEARVSAELDKLPCTRIIIAHRLSTVRTADLILVLSHGQLVERGTHDELMSAGGVYSELIAAQATAA